MENDQAAANGPGAPVGQPQSDTAGAVPGPDAPATGASDAPVDDRSAAKQVGPGTKYLAKPKQELRWSEAVEGALEADAVCQAIRSAVGFFTYKSSSWEGIRDAVDKDRNAVAISLQQQVTELLAAEQDKPGGGKKDESGEIIEASIVLVYGRAGAQPAPSDRSGIFSFSTLLSVTSMGSQRVTHYYDKDGRGTSEVRVNANHFAVQRLPVLNAVELGLDVALEPVLKDAAERGDAYVLRLDQWYSNTRRGPTWQPEWDTELVLLCFRKEILSDLVVTLYPVLEYGSDMLRITCIGLGGNELAVISLGRQAPVCELRTRLADQLDKPQHRLKLVSATKGLIETDAEGKALEQVLM